MSGRRPTIKDVAWAAGVSVTTVSHALNGKHRVAPATLDRVQRAAETLGYQPSIHALAMRDGRTRAIGLVVSVGDDAAWTIRLAHAAAVEALRHQHVLVLLPGAVGAPPAVDGAIITDPSAAAAWRARGTPVVELSPTGRRPEVAAAAAVAQLVALIRSSS